MKICACILIHKWCSATRIQLICILPIFLLQQRKKLEDCFSLTHIHTSPHALYNSIALLAMYAVIFIFDLFFAWPSVYPFDTILFECAFQFLNFLFFVLLKPFFGLFSLHHIQHICSGIKQTIQNQTKPNK